MYTELRDTARSHVSTGVSEVGRESCGRPKGGELLVNWSDLEGFPGQRRDGQEAAVGTGGRWRDRRQ